MEKTLTPEQEKLFVDESFRFMHNRMRWWRDNMKFVPTKILDVGACRGHWTDVAQDVWPDAEITMVEADPRVHQLLIEDYAHNRIITKGLAGQTGVFKFFARTGDHVQAAGSGSFMKEMTDVFQNDMTEFSVETDTADNLFNGEVFDYVKLDTQGSELEIMEGGKEIFKRTKFVQIECSFVPYNENAPMIADIVRYMQDHNFIPVDMLQLHGMTGGVVVQMDLLFINTTIQ